MLLYIADKILANEPYLTEVDSAIGDGDHGIGMATGMKNVKEVLLDMEGEDIALMRTIPGMVVISPADDLEARVAVKAAYKYEGPVYLRFGRLALPVIHNESDYTFEIGKGEILREGKDLTIVATGAMVSNSLEAAKKLKEDGIEAKVINIHTIKPLDEGLIVKAAKETGKIVTVEEHSVIGGLGSAVCDALAVKAPTQVLKIGINDTFGESGPAVELLKKYGLDADNIYAKIKSFVK